MTLKLSFIFLLGFFISIGVRANTCKQVDTSGFSESQLRVRGNQAEYKCITPMKIQFSHENKYINYMVPVFLSYAKIDPKNPNDLSITQFEFNQMLILMERYQLSRTQLLELKNSILEISNKIKTNEVAIYELIEAIEYYMRTKDEFSSWKWKYRGSKCWFVYGVDLIEITERLFGEGNSIFTNHNLTVSSQSGRIFTDLKDLLDSKELFLVYQCGGGTMREIFKYIN